MSLNDTTFDEFSWQSNVPVVTAHSKPSLLEKVKGVIEHITARTRTDADIDAYDLDDALKDFRADLDNLRTLLRNTVETLQDINIDEILAFKNLQRCWDGEDAEIIAPNAIDSALEFLQSYCGNLEFDAFPDPDGSVGLQADTSTGRILLGFLGDDTVAYFIRKGEEIQRGHGIPHTSFNKLLNALL